MKDFDMELTEGGRAALELYEDFLRKKFHGASKVNLRSARSIRAFNEIARKCSRLGLDIKIFFGIISQCLEFPYSNGSSKTIDFPYPDFLQSDACFSVVCKIIGRLFPRWQSRQLAEQVLASWSPSNYHSAFNGCFYRGTELLLLFSSSDCQVLEQEPGERLAFYLAYPDVFSDEFIFVSSAYWTLRQQKAVLSHSDSLLLKDTELLLRPLWEFQAKSKRFFFLLIEARDKVAAFEKRMLREKWEKVRSRWHLLF